MPFCSLLTAARGIAVGAAVALFINAAPVQAAVATTSPHGSSMTSTGSTGITKDANGKCHNASGKFVTCPASMMTTGTTGGAGVTKDANGKCHDASGKYVTCPSSMKGSTMKASPAPK